MNIQLKDGRFAAKLAVKLFILISFMGLAPFLVDETMKKQIEHVQLVIPQPWTLIFPALLALGFLTLLILCLVQKFRKPDINWLLTLNTLILLIYCIIAYIKILRFI